jgi:hypothetical protein
MASVSLRAITMEKTDKWHFVIFLTESVQTYDVIFSLVLRLITTSVIKHSVIGNEQPASFDIKGKYVNLRRISENCNKKL